MRSDAIWTSIATMLSVVSQLGIMLWLSQSGDLRLIGQLAILGIVLGLAGYLQDLGISNFIISEPELNDAQKSQLFFLSIVLSAITAILLVVAAPFVANFYTEQLLVTYIQIIALQIFIQGIGNQSQSALIKQHQLQPLAYIDIFSRVVMLVSFFLLQLEVSGILAFVMANIIFSLVRTIVLFHVYPPTLSVGKVAIDSQFLKRAISFGLYQSGAQILGYFRHRLDQLIFGKMIGLESLGQYSMAREITQQPFKILNPVISRLFLPRFTLHSKQRIHLHEALQLSLCSHMIAFSALALVSVTCIEFILPAEFSDVSILVVALLPYAVLKAPGMIFAVRAQSTGNVRREFHWNIWICVVTLPLLVMIATLTSLVTVAVLLSVWQNLLAFASLRYFEKSAVARASCYPLLAQFSAGSWILSLIIIWSMSFSK